MSEFKKEFDKLRELGSQGFTLRGTSLLVEVLPPIEMKTKSGIILQAVDAHARGNSIKAHEVKHGVVLYVGQGDYDFEKREYIPLDVEPGSVVVLPQFDIAFISTFPGMLKPTGNRIALVKANSILGFYPNVEAFEQAQRVLNE